MKIGLTIGKFAPLHKGHQYLIETALKEMDLLVVIVYAADSIPELSLDLRCKWLKDLYPQLVLIRGDKVPKDKGWTEAIQKKHETYVLSLVEAYNFTCFYSSEAYGDRMSKALKCRHRCLDGNRLNVPISGTEIRQNPQAYGDYLDDRILKDLQIIYGKKK